MLTTPYLLAGALVLSAAQPGEAPRAGFRDDFKTDSRKDYESHGEVSWRAGRLTLSDKAALVRSVSPGWTAAVRAVVRFEKGEKDDGIVALWIARDKVRAGLGLRLTAGKVVMVWSGNSSRPLTLAEAGAGVARTWEVRIDVAHGLGRFKAWPHGSAEPGDWQATGYNTLPFWEPTGLLIQVAGLPVSLEALSVSGPGPLRLGAEQQQELTRAGQANRRAVLLVAEGKANEALALLREGQKVLERLLPKGHVLIGLNLHNQGRALQESGFGLRAGAPLRRSLAILGKALPPDHPVLGDCEANLGAILVEEGKLEDARVLMEKVLAQQRKVLPPDHVLLAPALHNLAIALKEQGRVREARPLAELALKARTRALPPDHLDLAESLEVAGELARAEERFDEATRLCERALAARRKVLPADHPAVARSLSQLGRLHEDRGQLEQALGFYEQALAIVRKRMPPGHPMVAIGTNNLGRVLFRQGRIEQARIHAEESLAMRLRALGPDHFHVAVSHEFLGAILRDQGDLEGARKHFALALAINEKALPPSHLHRAITLDELGNVLRELGKLDEAERHIRRGVELHLAAGRREHTILASSLNSLGLLLRQRGRYREARDCLERSLAIQLKVLPPLHPGTATIRHNLARLLVDEGLMEEATAQFEQSLESVRKAAPPLHPQLFRIIASMGFIRRARGQSDQAWELFAEASVRRAGYLARVLGGTAEREHAALAARYRVPVDGLVSLALQWPDLDAARRLRLLEVVLDSKALGAAAVTQRQEALVLQEDEAARAEHARLRRLRQRLADLLLQGAGPEAPEAHRLACARVQQDHDDLERALGKRVRAYADLHQARRAGPRELAARLGAGAVLIEFIRHDYFLMPSGKLAVEGEDRYAALLVWQGPRKTVEVRLVPLGKAASIDRLIHRWRAQVQKGLAAEAEARPLRAAVWAPLARALPSKAKRLYVAPDGELALLPLEALRLEDGAYLIERYAVTYLSSGRDLIARPQPPGKSDLALVVADPDYEALDSRDAAKEPAKANLLALRAGEGILRGARFERLPGFAREADAVTALLTGRPGWKVAGARRARASEEQLLKAARPRLLYCITHGFFLQDVRRPASKDLFRDLEVLEGTSGRLRLPSFGGDPRLRSGLALAGANQWQKRAAKGLSDGWLTALEVENLDLWGTELVVLSACETGLGEVHVGEGVLGLRRAFQLAGTRTVVASLWKVPDAETQQLMTDFLQRWLKGAGKAEALRQAQLELIRRLRASPAAVRRSAPPLYWAGFICHGAPE
jgi:CHAT domain-containing protein/tetratricopeptide (TPR) repeat protein